MLGWSPESPFRPYEPRWNRALHGGRWLDGWWVSSGTAPPPLYRRDEWENETHTSGTCFPKGLCLILRPPHVKGDKNDVTRLIKHLLSSLWGWGYFLAVDLKTIILPALSTVAASWPFFLATTYFPLAARTHTWPSRHSSSNKPLFDLQQIKISLKMRVEVGEQLGFRCSSIQRVFVCVWAVTWWRRYTAVRRWLSESSIFQQPFWRHTSCPRGSSPSERLPGPLPHPDWLTGLCLEKVREKKHHELLLLQLLKLWWNQYSTGNFWWHAHWGTRSPPEQRELSQGSR